MHELSLAGGILQVVECAAARERFRRVRVLRLEAGVLAGVEIRALRFALDAIAPGTCLEGACIEIDEPEAGAWCMDCASRVTIRSRIDDCPGCGGGRLQPLDGAQLRVLAMTVHDD